MSTQDDIVAGYWIGRIIGRGASGSVHLARSLADGQWVALKLMGSPNAAVLASRPPAATDVTREFEAMRRLSHPCIVAILDAGHSQGRSWFTMPLARGVTLARYVAATRLLPTPVVLEVGARIADALAHAHALGVVHRDLKPSNVLVDLPTMQVTLLDFGVARIDDGMATRTGMTLGTPSYMAPEQLAGQPASPASDTYALGVLLFEMFTAQRPHRGASLGLLLRAIATQPATSLDVLRPDLPPAVVAELQTLLNADPHRRPGDLAAFAQRLRDLAGRMSAPERA